MVLLLVEARALDLLCMMSSVRWLNQMNPLTTALADVTIRDQEAVHTSLRFSFPLPLPLPSVPVQVSWKRSQAISF